jgi:hypothetical protein
MHHSDPGPGTCSRYRRSVPYLILDQEVEGRPDITLDLSSPGALETLKSKPFTIKEGSKYRMKGVFKVQHEVLSGLKASFSNMNLLHVLPIIGAGSNP